ncbi:MAG: hypothetical protein U5R06_00265 [candidate division KSB1 bacterium]|nr:hypothetical protein [candidate division KSB1 bacterium]
MNSFQCRLVFLFVFLTIAVVYGQKAEINYTPLQSGNELVFKEIPKNGYYQPLDRVVLTVNRPGVVVVRDATGDIYLKSDVESELVFQAGGALGTHRICLQDSDGKILDQARFYLGAQTQIRDKGGRYERLLNTLYWTMVKNWGETEVVRLDQSFYKFFVRWLRDHVHTLKGMKYFYEDLKSGIDLYAEYQRDDGMIYDNIYPRREKKNWWDKRFQYGDFIEHIDDNAYELKRIPVENDVEYLFIEGLYYTWKATGDDVWMQSHLDNALKAVEYSRTSPYRWSFEYDLLKRGFTIDTWDFQPAEDAARVGGDIMVVDTARTRFGVMFGDNTGMAAACEYLAEMLETAGRHVKATEIREFGQSLKQRLDELAWNGEYYIHHVPEDRSVRRNFGATDQSEQVSLSNAYSLNRTLTHEQCVAIIKTYQQIRDSMPETSPGEWYSIYPPFETGFHLPKWEYMNGGVTPIVAGELAHGAFEHGFENYAAGILERVAGLALETGDYLHCAYRGKAPAAVNRGFNPVSLADAGNSVYPGDESLFNGQSFSETAVSDRRAEFHHIPFYVRYAEDQQTCITVSRSNEWTDQSSVKIEQQAESVYFLHSSDPVRSPGAITLNYADGTHYTEYIVNQDNIGNWWHTASNAYKAWRSDNEGHYDALYVYGMNNPYPGKTIKTISFAAGSPKRYWVRGITLSDYPVYFPPDMISYGIPDNWGAAAVVYALIEGLAGVKDRGSAFDSVLIAPRWRAAGVSQANAVVKYEASGGYAAYNYQCGKDSVILELTGSGAGAAVRILIDDQTPSRVQVDGQPVPFEIDRVEASRYAVFSISEKGVNTVKLVF